MPETLSVFNSPQGEAEVLAAYERVLSLWPERFAERDVSTSFGSTHVIVGGPEDAPPIVFLHAFFATATVWYPNAGALSKGYRTYAVDVIGEANKSRPTRPIAKLDDFAQWLDELLDGLGVRRLVRHSVEWMRSGLPLDPAWGSCFTKSCCMAAMPIGSSPRCSRARS